MKHDVWCVIGPVGCSAPLMASDETFHAAHGVLQ